MSDEEAAALLEHGFPNNPVYFGNIVIDNLFTISLQLGAALWVVKDRLYAIEHLLVKKGILIEPEVEVFRVPADKEEERKAERNKFILDIYKALRDNPGTVSDASK